LVGGAVVELGYYRGVGFQLAVGPVGGEQDVAVAVGCQALDHHAGWEELEYIHHP
jgi:hypothetical protein